MNRAALETAIGEPLSAVPRSEVNRRLEAADIPFGDLLEVTEFVEHPQLAARGRWQPVETPNGVVESIVPAMDLEGAPHRMDPMPAVGQQTDEILAEAGYGPEEIAAFHAEGVV